MDTCLQPTFWHGSFLGLSIHLSGPYYLHPIFRPGDLSIFKHLGMDPKHQYNQQSGRVTFLHSNIKAAIYMMRFRCADIFILKH